MLRSIILVCLISIIHTANTTAQTLSIGPMVGANISTISDVPNAKSIIGLDLGIFSNFSINEHIGLGVKLLFSQLGTAIENSTSSVRLNYIQLPLTGVYYFGNTGNSFRPKIFAGPYIASLMSSKDQDGNDINDIYKNTDFGGLIGLGFNYSLKSRTWLNVDAGYAGSFSNITGITNTDYKNSGYSIKIGLSFPVSGS